MGCAEQREVYFSKTAIDIKVFTSSANLGKLQMGEKSLSNPNRREDHSSLHISHFLKEACMSLPLTISTPDTLNRWIDWPFFTFPHHVAGATISVSIFSPPRIMKKCCCVLKQNQVLIRQKGKVSN